MEHIEQTFEKDLDENERRFREIGIDTANKRVSVEYLESVYDLSQITRNERKDLGRVGLGLTVGDEVSFESDWREQKIQEWIRSGWRVYDLRSGRVYFDGGNRRIEEEAAQ